MRSAQVATTCRQTDRQTDELWYVVGKVEVGNGEGTASSQSRALRMAVIRWVDLTEFGVPSRSRSSARASARVVEP